MEINVSRERKQKISAYLTILALAGVGLAALAGADSESAKPGTTVITNVRIFDGGKVISSGAVVIKEGKIAAVGAKVAFPEDAEKSTKNGANS